jgi:cellobiose phosphorylase
MAVMYAYALYSRGFAKEGYLILNTIYKHSTNFSKSRIYPGLPEYFNHQGRGMYNYLTGSASWYILTYLTQALGIRGHYGDLYLQPQIVKEQFGKNKEIEVNTIFADRKLRIVFFNSEMMDVGRYEIRNIKINGSIIPYTPKERGAIIIREIINQLSENKSHEIRIELG